jgi:hypothetical protein
MDVGRSVGTRVVRTHRGAVPSMSSDQVQPTSTRSEAWSRSLSRAMTGMA